jgi:hypothetical protein
MGLRTFVVVPVAREWSLSPLYVFDQVVVTILQSHKMQDSRGGSSNVCRVECNVMYLSCYANTGLIIKICYHQLHTTVLVPK